jgi:hypothetical protein
MLSPLRVPVAAAICLPLVLASAGCDLATAELRSQETVEWRQSYTLDPGGRLEIVNTNGAIEAEPADGRTVEVIAHKQARGSSPEAAREAADQIRIAEDASPQAVRLETVQPRTSGLFGRGGGEVRYTVRVPADTDVSFRTVNGAITLHRLEGPIAARTTNGAIRAREVGGAIEASTTNGALDVDVRQITGAGVRLSCTNGGITLRLPADAAASISARVTNGGIDAQGLTLDRTETTPRRLEAGLNGGGPPVHLSSTNGGIRIAARN